MPRLVPLLILAASVAGPPAGQVKQTDGTEVMFPTVEEARQMLTVRDEFVERLSPFDRAARMKTDRDVSEEEFLEFVGKNALPWEPNEKEKLQAAFVYLRCEFLIVAENGEPGKTRASHDGRNPRLVTADQMSGFFEQTGRNTGYIIHPEEILADNFALLVEERPHVRSPEILEKMRKVLAEKAASGPGTPADIGKPRR
jgi:hypothetical protein